MSTASVQDSSLFRRLLARVGWELREMGFAPLRGFPLHGMVVSMFQPHHDEEPEDLFCAGSHASTPSPATLDPAWPRPWIFLRVFTVFMVLCIIFYHLYRHYPNYCVGLGLLALGGLGMPLGIVVWFMEVNVPRNVSLYRVLLVLLAGGFLSLAATKATDMIPLIKHLADEHPNTQVAVITEDLAKVLALMVVLGYRRYSYTLNGLLFGAAVGAGFVALENAGFAWYRGVAWKSTPILYATLLNRMSLALCTHVPWTALVGGALWHARRTHRFAFTAYFDWRFLAVLMMVTTLHVLWNTPVPLHLHEAKLVVLGVVAWLAILHMIQCGLNEVRDARDSARLADAAPPGCGVR